MVEPVTMSRQTCIVERTIEKVGDVDLVGQ